MDELPLNWAVKVNEYNFKHPVIRYLNHRFNSRWDGSQVYYGYRYSAPSGDQCWITLPKEITEVSIEDFIRITGYDFVDSRKSKNVSTESSSYVKHIIIPKVNKSVRLKEYKQVKINKLIIKINNVK